MANVKQTAKQKKREAAEEAAEKHRAEVAQKIVDDLNKDWHSDVLLRMCCTQFNVGTERIYSGCNLALLAYEMVGRGLDAPLWVGFKQASEKGAKIRKGSKASYVEKWGMAHFWEDENGKRYYHPSDSEKEALRERKFMRREFCNKVFNIRDVEDAPEEWVAKADEFAETYGKPAYENNEELEAIANRLIESSKWGIDEGGEVHAGAAGFYRAGHIYLCKRSSFNKLEGFISVLAHEMTHATAGMFPRECADYDTKAKKAKEELIAELGAMLVCGRLGIEADSVEDSRHAWHLEYLKSYLHGYKNDYKMIFEALDVAMKAADYIIERYESVGIAKAA